MKLLHSVALVAAVLLLADTVTSAAAGGNSWFTWSKTEEKQEVESKKVENVETLPKSEKLVVMKDEDIGVDDLDDDDDQFGSSPKKVPIEEDPQEGVGIPDIQELPPQGAGASYAPPQATVNNSASHNNQQQLYHYDPRPQQSEFVDPAPHPTVSQGPDPRFARPRGCSENQYLCRKASPTQEHLRCIPNEWKCNGVRDCEENDDEEGCSINVHRPAPLSCNSPSQYTCYGSGVNGLPVQCVNAEKVCNGVYDCSYGDDEDNDRCAQYAHKARDETIHSQQPPQHQPPQPPQHQHQPPEPSRERPIQNAPPQYPPQPQQPPQVQPQAQQCEGMSSKPEEYVKRLEWTDRCIRSCLSNNRH